MKIAIIGTGSWATALAQVLNDNNHDVLMFGIDNSQIDDINVHHRNRQYFSEEVVISEKIKAVNDLNFAISDAEMIVLSVPTSAMKEILDNIEPLLRRKVIFVNTSKGFDPNSNQRMSQLIKSSISSDKYYKIVSLIGPSHAEEVILRRLTLITATSRCKKAAKIVAQTFANDYFRVYLQKDEVGAELAVAMKNVIAIASGIIEGLQLGDNARAALVTRGLAEMTIFGRHFGGKMKTYLGLTGLGDLIVTCYSFHSRNFQAGLAIGKDDGAKNFLATNKKTVEGIKTAKTIHEIAKKNHLTMPIIDAVYQVLYEDKKPSQMAFLMMKRPLKEE
jgi:glycerol-3-phosphate dehydrogenase (NAD(P)+)